MKESFLIQNINRVKNLALMTCGILSVTILSCSEGNPKKPAQPTTTITITLKVQKITDTLEALTDMAFPGNGEMGVTEQGGKILSIRNGKLNSSPIMDLESKMVKLDKSYEERGLLGITLHPDFKSNKKFYVFYSRPSSSKTFNHTGVVSEYKLPGAGQVDPDCDRIILAVDEPVGNHNGCCFNVRPDGYLYISFDDGGGQHDQHGHNGNGQKLNPLLRQIVR